MKYKCPYCKECCERLFISGNQVSYCVLCNKYYVLTLNKGWVEAKKEEYG